MSRESIVSNGWRLIDAEGYSVKGGDMFKTFRNEVVHVVGGTAPHSSTSSGRVQLKYKDGNITEGYPQVVNCKWVRS